MQERASAAIASASRGLRKGFGMEEKERRAARGVEVPHSSYALAEIGRRVGRSRLRPGDILIFSGYGHVGLYVGRNRMVHAPNSGELVEVVRLSGSYYGSRLVLARRVTRS